jgi:hypothetical protein
MFSIVLLVEFLSYALILVYYINKQNTLYYQQVSAGINAIEEKS